MGFISVIPRWFGKYTKIQNISSLRPSDHIAIWDFSRMPLSYQHHGIVWTSGDSIDTIQVCHIWSPLSNFQEAQADSCFRISTLREFLSNRKPRNLRLVEYHTSGLRNALSSWGEVHFTKSDSPEVVLARCKFLMGLGKGEFNIFTQNCEHAAHWCKTGEQWCKQSLTRGKGQVPFESKLSKEQVAQLHEEIAEIKGQTIRETEKILALTGSVVRVRLNGNRYLQIDNHKVVATSNLHDAAMFRVTCYAKGYSCVKIIFFHDDSSRFMFSRSTLSCFRDVQMKTKACWRRPTGLKYEFTSTGLLMSMNQHRRYLGVRSDGRVVDVSVRGGASRFELLPIDNSPALPQTVMLSPETTQSDECV